jgi:hypothetical protein
MKLITSTIEKKLKKNFEKVQQTGETGKVELKLFGGNFTWLITEMEEDNDTLRGLCDIGHGFCEFGTVSLKEIKSIRLPPFGLGIERDMYFSGGTVEKFQKYYDEHGTLTGC